MKKILFLVVLCAVALSANAQMSSYLRSFYSQPYVQKYFKYAHHNAGAFNGVDIVSVTDNRVTLKASFEPNLWGSTYVCTINVFVDEWCRVINLTYHCDSPSRGVWPCFDHATSEIKNKCLSMSNNSAAISFMEQYFGKNFRQFNGKEAMCTLLNIAWWNEE